MRQAKNSEDAQKKDEPEAKDKGGQKEGTDTEMTDAGSEQKSKEWVINGESYLKPYWIQQKPHNLLQIRKYWGRKPEVCLWRRVNISGHST